jgi:hypothetical protein
VDSIGKQQGSKIQATSSYLAESNKRFSPCHAKLPMDAIDLLTHKDI